MGFGAVWCECQKASQGGGNEEGELAFLVSISPIGDQPLTSYLGFYQSTNLSYIRNNDICPITVVERLLKNKCRLFCHTVTPLHPDLRHMQDIAYIVPICDVNLQKEVEVWEFVNELFCSSD